MTQPAAWDDVVTAAFRTTIDRAARGVATLDERALLRTYAETLLAELGQHQAAITRVRDLADRWDNALAPDKPYARSLRAALNPPKEQQ